MTWLPSFEQILRFHKKLVESTGGAIEVRDKGLIDSAINRANASFGGFDLYVSVEEKAAAIGVGLIQNHGFVDGNKRIGIAAMLLILSRNGIRLDYSQADLVDLGLSIAKTELNIEGTVTWINDHAMGEK